jgi:hypothetical protein
VNGFNRCDNLNKHDLKIIKLTHSTHFIDVSALTFKYLGFSLQLFNVELIRLMFVVF